MNPYNQRKEPTFGKPTETAKEAQNKATDITATPFESEKNAENVENIKADKPRVTFSLSTKNAPGYTFTPVMKRPAESAQVLSTLEEKAEQIMSNEKSPQNESIATAEKPNGGFTFAPVKDEQPSNETANTTESKVETPTENSVNSTTERVIPTVTMKSTVEKVPSRYRRLLIVIALLLLVVLVIYELRPKTPESVEILQEQGAILPNEFRPVDEEEAKRAEAQAKALKEQQMQQSVQDNQLTQEQQAVTSPAVTAQSAQDVAVQPTDTAVETKAPTQMAVTEKATPVVVKPVVQEVKKPKTSESVIYQPETVNKPAKTTQVASQKSAPVKPQVHQAHNIAPQKVEAVKPAAIVKAQPVQVTAPASAIVASKTLTVPKGISLMQVFRNNNLNISDVNGMSKANNIVSNLKVGEKVTVRLDKNNRVAEMSIGSGGKFTRQANGSYIYK